jgi:hypothetical protein
LGISGGEGIVEVGCNIYVEDAEDDGNSTRRRSQSLFSLSHSFADHHHSTLSSIVLYHRCSHLMPTARVMLLIPLSNTAGSGWKQENVWTGLNPFEQHGARQKQRVFISCSCTYVGFHSSALVFDGLSSSLPNIHSQSHLSSTSNLLIISIYPSTSKNNQNSPRW